MTEVGERAYPKVLGQENVWAICGIEEGLVWWFPCEQRRLQIYAGTR